MLMMLTGDNAFALQRALDKLVDAYVDEHGELGLERIDAAEAGIERVREAITNVPLLADRKLVVLKEPGASKAVQEQAEQLFGDVPESTDVVIVEPKPDKRLSYYKFLKKHADVKEFPALDQGGLSRWLTETAKERGGSLSPSDARYLVERVGPDQQLLSNELEKLLLYEPAISRRTIDLLTEPTPQSSVFQLLEAAFAGDGRRAFRLYAEQRAQNVDPGKIIAMLTWQLYVLAVIKTAGGRPAGTIAGEARLNPYVVQKSQGIAGRLTMARLKELIDGLAGLDGRIKRTSVDADEALRQYLLGLSA